MSATLEALNGGVPLTPLATTDLMYIVRAGEDYPAELAALLALVAAEGGVDVELVRDTIAAALVAGALVSITPDDGADTITIAIDTATLDERIRDTIGAALAATTGLSINVDDAGNIIGFSVTFASTAEVRALTEAAKAVTPLKLADAAAFQTLTDAATVAWNMALGFNAKVTLGGNRTLGTPTNPKEGITYTLQVIQDGTGSRTFTWPASVSFGAAGNPTLSTLAGKIDLVTLICLDAATPVFRAGFIRAA